MLLKRNPLTPAIALSLIGALTLSGGAAAQKPKPIKSAEEISVSVSGSPVEFGVGKPMMQGESVLVPFRAVLEKLGSNVQYDPATKRIDASTPKYKVQLMPGSTAAKVNDRDITMAVAPKVVAGTLYIPLRFVSESLGATVQYDAAGKTIAIEPGNQDTTNETQTMNDANAPTNAPANAGSTDAPNVAPNSGDMTNMANNTDVNATTNDSNSAGTTGLSSDPANNGAMGASNDANATNAPVETAPANTTPATTTSTVAPTSSEPVSTEPSFFQQNMWPILGVLAALALAAIVYFALKGRRPGQVIASSSDKTRD